MDKFPEAFRRFERKVNTDKIETFRQLTLSFGSWSPRKWIPTRAQMDALAVQAKRLGIPLEGYRTRQQLIRTLFGQAQQTEIQERKFSRNYSNFHQWQSETARTTAYERRIINYIRNHPNASLAEARGHRAKKS